MTAEENLDQALALLNAFLSVGVTTFDLTLTDLAGRKLPAGFYSNRSVHQLRHQLRGLLPDASAHQHNVIVRPRPPAGTELVQLDDLAEQGIDPLVELSLMVIETSPTSYQAWLAVEGVVPDLKRRLRWGTGADPCASGATRISGSRNFKPRYAPHFPTVRLLACQPGNLVSSTTIEMRNLLAPPLPVKQASLATARSSANPGRWPSYQRCVQGAPSVSGRQDRPDISRADFTWCVIAIDWGWSLTATAARLMELSRKARENGQRYALRTAQNAAVVVAGRRASR